MRMSARSILLRVLLCVALVFNGAASATASVRMMQMHAQSDGAAASADAHASAMTESDTPCHHDGQAQHPEPGDSTAPAKPGHPAPGCCESGACTCSCVSHVVAMVPALAFRGISLADAGSIPPMALGHAAPGLPHLIRPPIG